jgi:hypothetical protein
VIRLPGEFVCYASVFYPKFPNMRYQDHLFALYTIILGVGVVVVGRIVTLHPRFVDHHQKCFVFPLAGPMLFQLKESRPVPRLPRAGCIRSDDIITPLLP